MRALFVVVSAPILQFFLGVCKAQEPVRVQTAVAGMQELLQSTMGGSIRIETKLGDDLWPAMADPTQLELAVLNLAINARDAMGIGGTLTVSTANVALGPPAGLCASVRNRLYFV